MAKFGSDQAQLFVLGGFDVLGSLTQFADKLEGITEPTHTLGDAWVEHSYVGLQRWEMTQEGFYDDGVGSVHEALSTGPGTTRVLVYGVEGNTSGKNFVGVQGAVQVDYERIIPLGELHKAKAQYRSNGVVEQGKIIRPLAGAVATGNTTNGAIDFTVSSSGGVGYLFITSLVGATATGLQVDIMHSADNLTFTSFIGFNAVTATAPNSSWAQRVSASGNVNRYIAARWQAGTGFPTSAIFGVGFSTE